MNKKNLVLPAVLVVAAAVVAAIQLWPSPLKDLRAKNLCLGMLTKETAGLLDDHKGGKLVVDEDKGEDAEADPVFSTICFVGRETSKDTTPRTQYTLDARPADTLNEPAKDAAPVGGGHSGWIGPRQSEVQLPASCAKPMGASAPHVTVTLKVAQGVLVKEDWDTAALISKSRTILLEGVGNLTEQYDCTT
ncbi:hypothetical protein [Streptomyces sp. NBC_01320]|uniref:hypothetical protein n=1 Tax=Streptomyces sp. NBC_01320 TaxID=2903824 RepID=UPI002E0DBACE|nr:hypothetical protein OG395_32450 [Streptomyces sp. NBC_01320]